MMDEIEIRIETTNREVSYPFFQLSRGTEVQPGLVFRGLIVRKGMDVIPEVLQFVVELSQNVEFGLIAAYLYEKIKDKSDTQICIRTRVVEDRTPEGIRRVIEQQIKGPANIDK
jgi:hypothetical protein